MSDRRDPQHPPRTDKGSAEDNLGEQGAGPQRRYES